MTLTACSSSHLESVRRVLDDEPPLAAGMRNYEAGRYDEATFAFQKVLRSKPDTADEITANKYLAFISCASKRERQCRAYFRRALELNPAFELTPAEASHPVIGPVFQNVKTRR